MVAVDSSSQSMLAFNGHRNVHGLYDFLLNHRFVICIGTLGQDPKVMPRSLSWLHLFFCMHRCLLSSTTGQDVPVLYSPISFQNASLVTAEV